MSAFLRVDNVDWKKVGKGALIAAAGALGTYLIETIGKIDFGIYQVLVGAILSIAANFLNKLLTAQESLEKK